jgi:hypothetical protein
MPESVVRVAAARLAKRITVSLPPPPSIVAFPGPGSKTLLLAFPLNVSVELERPEIRLAGNVVDRVTDASAKVTVSTFVKV